MSTARAVLSLLGLLARADEGMRADEVAAALGKSTSTAYNLLDTLCQEGFAVHDRGGAYRLTAESAALVPDNPRNGHAGDLAGVLDEVADVAGGRLAGAV